MTDVPFRDFVETRLTVIEQSLASEIKGLRQQLESHHLTHAREHEMVQRAVDKAEQSFLIRLDALSRRLDQSRDDLEKQANKWSNLEGRMYAIHAVVVLIIAIIGIALRAMGT